MAENTPLCSNTENKSEATTLLKEEKKSSACVRARDQERKIHKATEATKEKFTAFFVRDALKRGEVVDLRGLHMPQPFISVLCEITHDFEKWDDCGYVMWGYHPSYDLACYGSYHPASRENAEDYEEWNAIHKRFSKKGG